MMDAVSTCTRLLREGTEPSISVPVLSDIYPVSRRMSVSTIETYATTFERVKRISADCSSAECAYRNRTCPRVSHYLLSLPDSSIKLSTELASPRVHLDTTAHHALIIGSVRKAFRFHKPPLASYSGISRTPSIFSRALPQIICFSGASLLLLPPSHCTVLHSASDTVWYTEKPGAYVPHVFILRSVAVVNQYRPFGHPVRPRTGFQY